jgi:hypothetical protein
LEETIRRAKCLYDQQKGNPTFQKAWEDKKKSRWNKGRRETNHLFNVRVVKEILCIEIVLTEVEK